MRTLFILGQEDGKWHDIPESATYWEVAEKEELLTIEPYMDRYNSEPQNCVNFKTYLYRRVSLFDGDKGERYFVMMLSSSAESLMETLIKGYSPKPGL